MNILDAWIIAKTRARLFMEFSGRSQHCRVRFSGRSLHCGNGPGLCRKRCHLSERKKELFSSIPE